MVLDTKIAAGTTAVTLFAVDTLAAVYFVLGFGTGAVVTTVVIYYARRERP